MKFIIFLILNLSMVSHVAAGIKSCRLVLEPENQNALELPDEVSRARSYPNIRLNPGYVHAFRFAELYSAKLEKLVFGDPEHPFRDPHTIVIAMGGAEPLGILLRQIAQKRGYTNFQFIDAFLTTKIMNPWRGFVLNPETGNFSLKAQVGIGPPPDNFGAEILRDENGSDGSDVVLYLQQLGVYDRKNIVVVDTGFFGTTVEAVAYGARGLKLSTQIRGVLISHNWEDVENTVPIASLNRISQNTGGRASPSYWTFFVDNGRSPGDFHLGFQRSSTSATQLSLENGVWQPNVTSFTDRKSMRRHDAMILGLWEAVQASSEQH